MASAHPSARPGPAALHWVKPPQQARSQKTLENVLDAAEAVITESGMNGLTVSEVVKRAGSSVGAFYARFPDKDALLATLHQRSCAEALATAELALDAGRWKSTELSDAVLQIVRFTADLCRERRGLVLAFIAMAARDPAYAARRAELDRGFSALLHALLESRRCEIAVADSRLAAAVAVRMIMGSFEHGTTFETTASNLTDDTLSRELTHAVLAYLGVRRDAP